MHEKQIATVAGECLAALVSHGKIPPNKREVAEVAWEYADAWALEYARRYPVKGKDD